MVELSAEPLGGSGGTDGKAGLPKTREEEFTTSGERGLSLDQTTLVRRFVSPAQGFLKTELLGIVATQTTVWRCPTAE